MHIWTIYVIWANFILYYAFLFHFGDWQVTITYMERAALRLFINYTLSSSSISTRGRYWFSIRPTEHNKDKTAKLSFVSRVLHSDNDEKPLKSSQHSLNGDLKGGDSGDSMVDYGDEDAHFNEDGSFIGEYAGRKARVSMEIKGNNQSTA